MHRQQKSRRPWILLVLAIAMTAGVVVAWTPLKALGTLVMYRWFPDYPKAKDKTLAVPGFQQKVRIDFDKLGVPHVEANNALDLVRAVGFLHGRDRFFQMDMLRRIAGGRVSEMVGRQPFLGSDTLQFDRSMRGWGFARRARVELKTMPAKDIALLKAYAAGVNAALAHHKALEYRLMQRAPEPWKAIDSLLVGILNSWSISHNWQQELVRFLLAYHVGVKRASAIYPHEPLDGASLPPAQKARKLETAIHPELRTLFANAHFKPKAPTTKQATRLPKAAKRPRKLAQVHRQALDIAEAVSTWFHGASNAWVVSGARSRSGKPLLANDPHLTHFLPSLMYQQHLKAPGLDAIGVAFPGLPYILMGHNQRVAWGITSAVADAIDLVIEKPRGEKPTTIPGRYHNKACAVTYETSVIKERKGSRLIAHKFPLRRTCRGPLLNDLYPALVPKSAPWISVQWEPKGFGRGVLLFGEAGRSTSVQDLRKRLSPLSTPVSTCQAADVDGNIALFWVGTIPSRKHRGTFPYPGWHDDHQWRGLLDYDKIPHGLNPASGFFAHGNNLLADPRHQPHTYHIDSAPGYRFKRISSLLKETPKHDFKSFEAIQRDVKLLRAQAVVPHILDDLRQLGPNEVLARQARVLLQRWDFDASAKSVAASLFFETYRRAMQAAILDELPPKAVRFMMTQRYSTNVADGWFANPTHVIWDKRDTTATETRGTIVRQAFRDAVSALSKQFGGHIEQWHWGRLHQFKIRHFFGAKAMLRDLLNIPDHPSPGGLDSVWKTHFNMGHPTSPYKVVAGPVFRMVVDLNDIHHARWIIDTGASGWPKSPHYKDQFSHWHKGKTLPMLSNWTEIRGQAHHTWTLTPPR